MATLLNTLLASLFPVLFAPHDELPATKISEIAVEVTVLKEQSIDHDYRVYYYYPQRKISRHL